MNLRPAARVQALVTTSKLARVPAGAGRVALAALVLLVALPAAARPGASDAIRSGNDRLRALLGKKVEGDEAARKLAAEVTTELRDLFDIGFLAERALVDHWGKMTPEQRTGVVDTLRSVVEQNYVAQLRGNLAYEVVYLGEDGGGDDVVVKTAIRAQRKGRPTEIKVDYRLRYVGDHWRAYDVVTDEVSLLDNYRGQFNRIIAKEGVDGLIRRMQGKLKKP